MRKARLALASLAVGLAVACSSAGTFSNIGNNLDSSRAVAPAPAGQAGGSVGYGPDSAAKQGQGESSSGVLGVLFQSDKVLILTAQLQLRSADPWAVSKKVQQVALGFGGDVVGVNESGTGDSKSAVVTIRVPNDQFNTALQQIKTIDGADLQSAQVTGEDKTEQFIDLDARLKAKQQEESRYLALLAKANTVDEILKVDQVLSTVRAQIEQLQGQLNALKNRSAMATITTAVSTTPILPSPIETGWQPQRTFQAAVAALGGMLRVFADVAIWALVWSWLPLLALGFLYVLSRRVRTAA
jgi:hypothetical protein